MSHCRGTIEAHCWCCENTFKVANGFSIQEPFPSFGLSSLICFTECQNHTHDSGLRIQVEPSSCRKVSVALSTIIWVSFGTIWTWTIICDAGPMKSMLRMPIRIWWHQDCTMMKVTCAKTSRVGCDVWMMAILIAALNTLNLFSAGLIWLLSWVLK